jgi:hypothetical protein
MLNRVIMPKQSCHVKQSLYRFCFVSQDDVLNWTATMPVDKSGNSDRIALAKGIIYQMTSSELKKMISIVAHAKGRLTSLEMKYAAAAAEAEEEGRRMVALEPSMIALPSLPYIPPDQFKQLQKCMHSLSNVTIICN